MEAFISSIVGALVGGFFTWYVNRRRPHIVVCEEEYLGEFYLDVPETAIIFRGTPVEKLGLLRLSFRNSGTHAIMNPSMIICLDDDSTILGCSEKFLPERNDSSEGSSELQAEANRQQYFIKSSVKKNQVHLSVDRLLPYTTNEEKIVLDVFTKGEVKNVEALGSGVMQDGTGWSVALKPLKKLQERTSTLSVSSFIILCVLFIICFYLRLWPHVVTFGQSEAFDQWARDPLLWALIGGRY